MKKFLIAGVILLVIVLVTPSFIIENDQAPVDPHLVLGQAIHFRGCVPEKTYLIVGYRETYEGPVEKKWMDQEYLAFVYITDLGEYKMGTIHRNSVIKE
ncbi:hypothetical protein [Persicobacter diffluens]|uniref:Uncharacterized protein n=1 Tax=Persicobacter diffluens TaxID=981 RepID=A0AAN4VYG0_9BACT|nr:hypothetical protein PEDI_21010 [Persicobacter diffluens]